MRITIKKRRLNTALLILVFLAASFVVFTGSIFNGNFASAATNVTNNTVFARVNITNSPPNITQVIVDDDNNNPGFTIDLTANEVKNVWCNATVFDFNGASDINSSAVNATLYIVSEGRDGSADNNHRYLNESCGSCTQLTATTTLCDCKFPLRYYANDSNQWRCNISVRDLGGYTTSSTKLQFNDTEVSNLTTVTSLLAINTSTLLDYGNMSTTQTSNMREHNVTNAGNIDLNLTLRGYGGINETEGQNVTMVCELGNISFGNQRYSLGVDASGVAYESMVNLSNQTRLTNLTLPQKTNDNGVDGAQNSTFWRLYVPPTVAGVCNGTIIFGAIDTEG